MTHRTVPFLMGMPRRTLWSRFAMFLGLVALLFAQGCTQILDEGPGGGTGGGVIPPAPSGGPLAADIRIVSDPQGGTYVSELTCLFEATQIPGTGADPVAIRVSWVAPCGTHKTETFVFDGGTQTYESSYSEGGRALGMTFWATISWKDARGSHQLQSGLAACQ